MNIRATVRLRPQLVWSTGPDGADPLDRRLMPLLAAIRRHATLGRAAEEIGISYRSAWGLLGRAAAQLGIALVELEKGRGSRLTPAAEQLLATEGRIARRLEAVELTGRTEPARRAAGRPADRRGIRIVCSHDLALAELCERWAIPAGVVAELAFRGSIESVSRYARGEADVAGFHLVEPLEEPAAALFRGLLDARRDRLIRFAGRSQGLIVPRGNPRALSSLADVARRRVRFVNRQRGSGTRLLLDQLLTASRIAPSAIRGYGTEEHTHLAVAATVASGQADVGFGLHAAAARFGLGFVPIRAERYWLVARSRQLETPGIRSFLAALSGPRLARVARRLPGYAITEAGRVVPLALGLAPG